MFFSIKVRDEYRQDYDAGRGGYGKLAQNQWVVRAPSWKLTPLACWICCALPKVCKPAHFYHALIKVSTELEAFSWFSFENYERTESKRMPLFCSLRILAISQGARMILCHQVRICVRGNNFDVSAQDSRLLGRWKILKIDKKFMVFIGALKFFKFAGNKNVINRVLLYCITLLWISKMFDSWVLFSVLSSNL